MERNQFITDYKSQNNFAFFSQFLFLKQELIFLESSNLYLGAVAGSFRV